MSFEAYKQFYYDEKGTTLRPFGKPFSVSFELDKKQNKHYRLYATGESGMFYQWKGEYDMPGRYRIISDALDTKHAELSRYCADLSSKKAEDYPRLMYKKIMWPPVLSYLKLAYLTEGFSFGIRVKTNNLVVEADGHITMRVAGHLKKEGKYNGSIIGDFDFCYDLDLNVDTKNEWVELSRDIIIPESTANVGVWVEGYGYSGEVYVEAPHLTSDSGWNVLHEFDRPNSSNAKFEWLGMNLSRVEWPEFKLVLNGVTVFEGARFERCHRFSEWEIELPMEALKEKNSLEIYLVSDYEDATVYTLHEMGIIEQAGGEVAIIASPEIGYVDDGVCVLIRTEKDNAEIAFSSDGVLKGERVYRFEEKGLHGIRLTANECAENASFTLACGDTSVNGVVKYILKASDKGVVTGTGDMIYVNTEPEDIEEYLSWYISNNIGNFFTIRPTYRWSGVRVLKRGAWRTVARILNEMQISYVIIVDGRELPGLNAQPDNELIGGKYFMGRQTHERDGATLYWGNMTYGDNLIGEQYNDMVYYIFKKDSAHSNNRCVDGNLYYRDGKVYLNRDPGRIRDMRDAAQAKISELTAIRNGCTRHTGPACIFTPFVKSGFEWLGAETMYGTIEVQMAFLRGSQLSNGIARNGVHHAVQWSSSPQDAPEHIRRYRLALYSSYIQDANDINTEEGLWHLEEYYSHFNRFDNCCGAHKKQQQDFCRYVKAHTRKGKFYANSAIMQGRFDGWIGFTNEHPWGWYDRHDSEAEDSWQLLKVLYPLSQPGAAVYCHGCDTKSEPGYYSGTPFGNINVLPAESNTDKIGDYRLLAFLGYHCAEKEDFDRLEGYVANGGALILTRAHLCNTTLFDDISANNIVEIENHPLGKTNGAPIYAIEHFNGLTVKACKNITTPDKVICSTDEGTPLAAEYLIGKGRLILVNALCYPSNEAIKGLYGKLLSESVKANKALEEIWCETDEKVEFSVYDNDDGSRTIYLLAVDWYHHDDEKRTARLIIGENKYELDVKFGTLYKCVAKNGKAIIAMDENGEISSFDGEKATISCCGEAKFLLLDNGSTLEVCKNCISGIIEL